MNNSNDPHNGPPEEVQQMFRTLAAKPESGWTYQLSLVLGDGFHFYGMTVADVGHSDKNYVFQCENVEALIRSKDKRIEKLQARIAELEAELAEEKRLNGMGSEREAVKYARIAELEAIVDGLPKTADGVRKLLSYIYLLAYHRGHDNTCESRYTDVYHTDAFTYWAEDVEEILSEGGVVSLLDAQADLAAEAAKQKEGKQ